MKKIILVSLTLVLISACVPANIPLDESVTSPPDSVATQQPPIEPTAGNPSAPPFAPLPGDGNLQRGDVFISASELLIRESFPIQIALALSGETPTPCHQLRVVVNRPDSKNNIHVEAYTISNPELNCIQVVEPFQETVELGSFPTGHYTVWINDTQVGEFDA